MPAAATTYTGLRDALVATLSTIDGLAVYGWQPHAYQACPAVGLGLPALSRTRPDEPEQYLTKDTLYVSWPAELVVLLHGPERAYDDALEWVARVQRAIDTDQSLTTLTGSSHPGIKRAVVASAEPRFPEDQGRQLIAYDVTFDITLNL